MGDIVNRVGESLTGIPRCDIYLAVKIFRVGVIVVVLKEDLYFQQLRRAIIGNIESVKKLGSLVYARFY